MFNLMIDVHVMVILATRTFRGSPCSSPGSSLGSNPGFDVSLSPSLLVLAKSIH